MATLGGYQLGARIGLGGMAEVFEAFRDGPHGFRKRVALKRILPHLVENPAFVSMFVAEAAIAARLEHPNIVQVFDFGEDRGELYLAMEHVDGASLYRVLKVLRVRDEQLPIDAVLHIGAQTARALAYAHDARDTQGRRLGLVHRDVTPGNLLLTRTGHVKLGDFGIARTEASESFTAKHNLRGKIGYVSPEQVRGQHLDGKSDVFTLCAVIAEMLLGEPLFAYGDDRSVLIRIRDGDLSRLEQTQKQIPADVRRLLMAGLSIDRELRPRATALASALEHALQRRRLAADAARRVSALLKRHELVDDDRPACSTEPGARPTSIIPMDALDDPSMAGPRVSLRGLPSSARYLAHLNDRTIGPVPFPELVRLATSGEIDSGTPVGRDGGTPVPAVELPELSRIFATPALQWQPTEVQTPRMRGDVRAAVLLPLIHSLYAQRENGVLYLEADGRKKKIYFTSGRPEFVASSSRDELLGRYLVEHGHCMDMEVDMALALMPHYGGRLGDALVDLGALRPVELYRAVASQVRSRYLEAFRWRAGRWSYVPEARSGEETYPIEQDAQALMRDASFELHPSEVEAALAPIWETVVRVRPDPPAPLTAYDLPDAWSWLLRRADDGATVGGLFGVASRQSGIDEEEAMRAIFLGVSCQILQAA